MQKKRIGFVDHDLDNFHANTYLAAIRGPLLERGFVVSGATARVTAENRDWCDRHGVPWFDDVSQLNEACDHFAILAPAHPERHLELCNLVFPYGKPTFVDKPLCTNLEEAELIFARADAEGTPVQSTSALRTTNVQPWVGQQDAQLRHLAVYAGGTSWREYGIHPVELVVSCLGANIQQVRTLGSERHPLIVLEYPAGLTATITFNAEAHLDFEVVMSTEAETLHTRVDMDRLFVDAASAILDFFDAAEPLIDRQETLTVHRVLQSVAQEIGRTLEGVAL